MTKAIQKNIPFALLDAVIPSNAQESNVYALPAVASFIEVVAALSASVATETVTCSIYGGESVSGPFVLISSALVPANATNITQSFGAFVAFTHIKVVLSSVTIVSSTLSVTVNAKDSNGSFSGLPVTGFLTFAEGSGLKFLGPANPITMVGGDDGFGDTAIIIDNVDDGYVVLKFPSVTDIYVDGGASLSGTSGYLSLNRTTIDGIQVGGNSVFDDHVGIGGDNFITNRFSVLGTSKFYNAPATTTADNPLFTIQTEFISTGGNATDLIVPLRVATIAGTNAEATKGSIQNYTGGIIVRGVGSNTNEYGYFVGGISYEIGAGYTQTTGPTGAAWLADLGVAGPIGVQPVTLGGWTIVMNNPYNGSPSAHPSYAYAAVNYPTFGPNVDALHIAATTYPIDQGMYIGGKSGTLGSPIGVGFTIGLQIGGAGSNWGVPSSIIGTPIDISDYTTRGIYIHGAIGSPTASIDADGLIIGDTFKPLTAYKSTDGSAGATTTITTASLVGKTVTVKNGLITAFA